MANVPTHMSVEIKGLKCDKEGCDYVDESVTKVKEELVGRKCPCCGSVLLTQEDYDAAMRMQEMVDSVNAVGNAMTEMFGLNNNQLQAEPFAARVSGDGSGRLTVRTERKPDDSPVRSAIADALDGMKI